MPKKLLQRVDVQVTILVVIIVAFSGLLIYSLVYTMSYREMINMLENEAEAVVSYIEERLDTDIFLEIKTKEDMERKNYQNAHALLDEIRTLSCIKYLYTAVQNDNGDLIYHVDGLPYEDSDFRNVGDLIEDEFQMPLLTALGNEIVLPEDILSTEWGDVYVSYYPLHGKDGNIVAAIGIEFPADSQSSAYQKIRFIVNTVLVFICIIAGFLARFLFQRISNPHFKDMYNTDSLTKLKNRNAFDTDIYNYIQVQRVKDLVLVITDLNGLKPVNDKFGHKMGDFYIEACAKALLIDDMDYCVVYRIGGDEFATIIPSKHASKAEYYMQAVQEKLTKLCENTLSSASVSMGYAICNGDSLNDWEEAYKKADEAMYQTKRNYYEKNKAQDKRK